MQFSGWCESFREDEVLERDRQHSFALEPPVGNDSDEVLGRHRLIERHDEGENVLLTGILFFEDELFVVQYLL